MDECISSLFARIRQENILSGESAAVIEKKKTEGIKLSEVWERLTQQGVDREYDEQLLTWTPLHQHVLKPKTNKQDRRLIRTWAKLFIELGKVLVELKLDFRLEELCQSQYVSTLPNHFSLVLSTLGQACSGDLKSVNKTLLKLTNDWDGLYIPFRNVLWECRKRSDSFFVNSIREVIVSHNEKETLRAYQARCEHEKQNALDTQKRQQLDQNYRGWLLEGWEAVRKHHIGNRDADGFLPYHFYRFEGDGYVVECGTLPEKQPDKERVVAWFIKGWAENWMRLWAWVRLDKQLFEKATRYLEGGEQSDEAWLLNRVCHKAMDKELELLQEFLRSAHDLPWPRFKNFLDAMDRFGQVIGTVLVKPIPLPVNLTANEGELVIRDVSNTKETASTGSSVNSEQTSKLSDREENILVEMLSLGAINNSKRQTMATIVSKCGRKETPDNYKREFSRLNSLGFTASLAGRKGGNWLTSKGKKRAQEIQQSISIAGNSYK